MRILIVGGTGFIGGTVLRQLAERNHELMAVQRRPSSLVPESVRQISCDQDRLAQAMSDLRRFKADVVVDMISSSAKQARLTVETFTGYAGRLVSISSQDVYRAFGVFNGMEEGPLEPVPLDEDSARRTRRDTYPPAVLERLRQTMGWVTEEYSKSEMEDVVTTTTTLPCTVLRLPMVHGPGDRIHRLYPIVKRVDDGRVVIPIADAVAPWRCPRGFVDDVASAIVLAAESEKAAGEVFNVGEQECLSELEWTTLVAGAAGWTGSIVVVPFELAPAHLRLPGNFAQHAASSSHRIRERLGYREITPRAEALRRTIAWERSNPPDPLPQFDYDAEDKWLNG